METINTPLGNFTLGENLYDYIPKMNEGPLHCLCDRCDEIVYTSKKSFCKACHPKLKMAETRQEYIEVMRFMVEYMHNEVCGKWNKVKMAYIVFEYSKLNQNWLKDYEKLRAMVTQKYTEFCNTEFDMVGETFQERYACFAQ